MVGDPWGRPLRFIVTEGQRHDSTQARALLTGFTAGYVIADKGYESQAFIAYLEGQGATPVIPPLAGRTQPRSYDRALYKHRNWSERPCNKLKHWRRLATRYERKTAHFLAFLHLAALPLWIPSMSIQPSTGVPLGGSHTRDVYQWRDRVDGARTPCVGWSP